MAEAMPLFDVNAGFGGRSPGVREVVSADDLLAEMARLDIARALVRTTPVKRDMNALGSNERLLSACADVDALAACPVALPNTGRDVADEDEQVDGLLARGAAAVWIRPKTDYWVVDEWCGGRLFDALARRRVPVFCAEGEVPLADAADLAGRYPDLPIVLAEFGYRRQREILGLLAGFANVHLAMGGAFSIHRGLEQLAGEGFAERVLFGTGYPAAEPAAAVALLMYAEVSDRQKAMIGAGNLKRLIGGLRR